MLELDIFDIKEPDYKEIDPCVSMPYLWFLSRKLLMIVLR
jgi:hypothetical protein